MNLHLEILLISMIASLVISIPLGIISFNLESGIVSFLIMVSPTTVVFGMILFGVSEVYMWLSGCQVRIDHAGEP